MSQKSISLDINLTTKDIQDLSTADAIAAFFSKLGYNTNARTPQTPENLGISSDAALKSIKSIELIADQENFLQVYLFEVKSVTISHIRALANSFKNKAPNFLFVLTSDYERIDFVLLERIRPEQSTKKSIVIKQVGIRTRVLTIDRKHDSSDRFRIALRVLRRFTYTENDSIAQYDKIKSAYTIADWSEEFFNNKALFSDYYLKVRLPGEYKEWKEDPKPAFQELNQLLFPMIQELRGQKEQVLRKNLLEPVFEVLGFDWLAGKKAGSEAQEPDYFLKAPSEKETLAFCLAYPWARHLDGKDPKDPESPNEDPSRLVVSLLESGETPWAIVTNGKVWRLYTAKTHSKASNYYEIDFEEVLVHSGKTDAYAEFFKYFWLFFRSQAFESVPVDVEGETREATFLDRLLTESEQYAKELGERLKEQVFEQIFPHLAEGFIVNIREQEGKDTEFSSERLDQIFQGTLTLLYRLLFLLYAEARDLLPVKEIRGYHEVSLTKIKTEIAEAAGTLLGQAPAKLKKVYSKSEYSLHERLNRLFAVIDAGDSSLNVPIYNGGLFLNTVHPEDQSAEAQNTRFLNAHQVPDLYLALALNLLTRDIDPKSEALVSIDFKSLGVRQLGSIYEGLLEFKVRVAPEKMAVVKGKKTEEIIPYKQAEKDNRKIFTVGQGRNAKERTFPKGAVYLENDKHERKATGSYYTPDHIVKYIVENAVGPVLEEKFEQTMRPKLREAQQSYNEAKKRKEAFEKQKMQGDDPEKVANTYKHVVDELFNVKVLDPAMGSGHFLVEAVDFITDKAIHFLNAFPWNPVTQYLEETRGTILSEMDQQGVSIDPARLTDINLLKRHVLKRCIYGVDLNPMAVELAKVSLWLNCFTLGAPLSFLDHHMKCGNSLIGSKVDEAQKAIETGQTLLFGGSQFTGLMIATQLMRHVGELSDVTSAQVQESRKEYKEALDKLQPFKRILDVYTSQWFSNPIRTVGRGRTKKEVNDALDFLKSQDCQNWIENKLDTKHLDKESKAIIQASIADTITNHFFHWELEFPEVFYGSKAGTTQAIERLDNGGFDAVVGNPPYFELSALPKTTHLGLKVLYENLVFGKSNIYILFWGLGIRLAAREGYTAFITSNKFLCTQNGYPIRKLFLTHCKMLSAIDFRHLRVFGPQIETYSCVFVLKKQRVIDEYDLPVFRYKSEEIESKGSLDESDFIDFKIPVNVFKNNHDSLLDISVPPEARPLLDYMEKSEWFRPLVSLCDIKRGVTAIGQKDLIDKYVESQILSVNANQVEPCFITSPYFYLNKEIEISEFHFKSKILIKDICKQITCAYDAKGLVCPSSIYYLFPKDKGNTPSVLAYLNSSLATAYYLFKYQSTQLTLGWIRVKGYYIEMLPTLQVGEKENKEFGLLLNELTESQKSLFGELTVCRKRNLSYTPSSKFNLEKFKKDYDNTLGLLKEIDLKIFTSIALPDDLQKLTLDLVGERYLPCECILRGVWTPRAPKIESDDE